MESPYIDLQSLRSTQTREIVEGLNVDRDANGDVVGFDIDHASGKLDLSSIETIALPPVSATDSYLSDATVTASGGGDGLSAGRTRIISSVLDNRYSRISVQRRTQ
jgi:uncharacterized protein YuzE